MLCCFVVRVGRCSAHDMPIMKKVSKYHDDNGTLGFEFCVFVAGWRLALWSEWPFIIIIIINLHKSIC